MISGTPGGSTIISGTPGGKGRRGCTMHSKHITHNGISLSHREKSLYWSSNSLLHRPTIRRSQLDGSGIEVVLEAACIG